MKGSDLGIVNSLINKKVKDTDVGNLANEIKDVQSQLEHNTTQLEEHLANHPSGNIGVNVNIENYPRLSDESDDSPRIQRCFDENENCIIIFPKGNYEIYATVKGKNISMDCDTQTFFNANTTGNMYYMFELFYEGEFDEDFQGTYNPYHYFVNKGVFNGQGIANGILSYGGHNNTFEGSLFLDCKLYGLTVGKTGISTSKYYINNCTARCKKNIGVNNIGFNLGGSDCHIVDCTAVNYVTGFYSGGGSHRWARCHYWITQASMKEKSKAFYCGGSGNTYFDCFLDTSKIGFDVIGDGEFTNCGGFNNRKYGLNNCTYFKINNSTKSIKITGGHINDIDVGATFLGGILPSHNVEINGVSGTDTIKYLPKSNKECYNSSDKLTGIGYNFLNFNLYSKKTNVINCYETSCNFDIEIINKTGKFTVNITVIKSLDGVTFIANGNSKAVDRLKILKCLDGESYIYKIIYKKIDNNDILMFNIKNINGKFVKANEAGGITTETLGMKYLSTFGVLDVFEQSGVIYSDEITEPNSTEIQIGVSDNDETVTPPPQNIPVTSVNIYPTSMALNVAESKTVTSSVLPSNATNKKITYETEIKDIAVVTSEGVVTGVGVGSTNIKAISDDGNKVANCLVTVSNDSEQEIISGEFLRIPNTIAGDMDKNIIIEGNSTGYFNQISTSSLKFMIVNHGKEINIGAFTDNKEIGSNGVESNSTTSVVSDFFEVKPNTSYVIYLLNGKFTYLKLAQYDENKTFLKRTLSSNTDNKLFITTDAMTKHIKFSIQSNTLDDTKNIVPYLVFAEGYGKELYSANTNPLRSSTDNLVKDEIVYDGIKIRHTQKIDENRDILTTNIIKDVTGKLDLIFKTFNEETVITTLPGIDSEVRALIKLDIK